MLLKNKKSDWRNKDFMMMFGKNLHILDNEEKKLLYKMVMRKYNDNQSKIPHLINSWCRESEDGEQKTTVSIFNNCKKAMEYIKNNFELEPTWNTSPYDCSGRWYLESADVLVIDNRIIVKQVEYLDV